jgi:hypothetical protein
VADQCVAPAHRTLDALLACAWRCALFLTSLLAFELRNDILLVIGRTTDSVAALIRLEPYGGDALAHSKVSLKQAEFERDAAK